MQKPIIDLSARKGTFVQIPCFLLDYTSDLSTFLELKRSFTEMFTHWVQSDDYKSKCQGNDYTPEIHFYIQELFDSIFVAQKGGEIDVQLTINHSSNRN